MSEYTQTGMYWKCNLCNGLTFRHLPYCGHCSKGQAPDVTKEVRPERLSEETRPDISPDLTTGWLQCPYYSEVLPDIIPGDA